MSLYHHCNSTLYWIQTAHLQTKSTEKMKKSAFIVLNDLIIITKNGRNKKKNGAKSKKICRQLKYEKSDERNNDSTK